MAKDSLPLVLDRDSPVPIYRQVQAWLRQQIESGALMPGSMLPPVKLLCERLGGINHQTVRQAISLLVQEGALSAIPGRGAVVASQAERTVKIGLVLPNIDSELTRQIANGVQSVFEPEVISVDGKDSLRREKASVVILDSRHNVKKEIENIAHLEDLPLDGAIILPVVYGDIVKHLVRLQSDDFPVVLVDCMVPGLSFPSVVVDNYGGSYEITKHVLERGRKKLAWIGPAMSISSASQRFEGYRDAIADFGLPFDRKLVTSIATTLPTDPFEPFVQNVIDGLVKGHPERPDAIVCGNDAIAIGCIKMLKAHGVKVPEDIAVVGFDDVQEARLCDPPLTTVRQPMGELGGAAARLILARIFNKECDPTVEKFPVELVVRQSS